MPLTDEQAKSFSATIQPIVAWLRANVPALHTVIVDANGAELLEGRAIALYATPREEPKEPEPKPESKPEPDMWAEPEPKPEPEPEPKNPENTIAAFLQKEAAMLRARILSGGTPWAHPPIEGAGTSPELVRESKNPPPPDWRPEPPPPPPPKIADPASSQRPGDRYLSCTDGLTDPVPAAWTLRTDTPAQFAGKRFKAWRKFRGIKRAELAAAVDVSLTYFGEWETGERTPIPIRAWGQLGFHGDPWVLPQGKLKT